MTFPKRCLIANRGEIALRLIRSLHDLEMEAVAVFAEDDADAPHRRAADHAMALPGEGPAAYLDEAQIIRVARETGCDALHPGYGFLSERASLARACVAEGLRFIGPEPETLELFGHKGRARELALAHGVPVLPGTEAGASLAEIEAFWDAENAGAIMLKAVAGGGGRGLRVVTSREAVAEGLARCQSEARATWGDDAVLAERYVQRGRHIEIQLVGDGEQITHLWERECTLQRRHQKVIETCPALELEASLREKLLEAAVRLGQAARVKTLITMEFLVDAVTGHFYFLEANPRLQVEHTVTEEVTGLDLVELQIATSGGSTLASLGLSEPPQIRGAAAQARVLLERWSPDGSVAPTSGTVTAYRAPEGPGVRVDGWAHVGAQTNTRFDTLLMKVVAHARKGDTRAALSKLERALGELELAGVESNIEGLRAILQHPSLTSSRIDTRFVEQVIFPALPERTSRGTGDEGRMLSPLPGTVISLEVATGEAVVAGQTVAVLESMKMEHAIVAEVSGRVRGIPCAVGETVAEGAVLVELEIDPEAQGARGAEAVVDLEHIRPELAELRARMRWTRDEARPEAVAKRRARGQRTARENLADLFDGGSYQEYGALAVAAQRKRRSMDSLVTRTPADGLITALGTVNAERFGEEAARCAGLAYDYTVLAGTQGFFNHLKTDRILALAAESRMPVVWYVEGGGGRPGDVDVEGVVVSGLTTTSFRAYAELSGVVPRIGIASGRCFAGNAVFFGCSDVTIATEDANIGLGGPAMIAGGGLGQYRPEDIGPTQVQAANGVVDIVARDEVEATSVAKRVLGFFQGREAEWSSADQRGLRYLVPENRRRVYDVREVIETLVDEGSLVELRRGYGVGMVTALARIEGWPFGVLANVPGHLGGAIDSEAAEKASRFMQLCDAFGVPMVSLVDTPGFMVGPESEETASVRRGSRMFVTSASMAVPMFTVVLRKAYGLGAQAMAGGHLHASFSTVSWPTGELGGMGLEGAVALGFRKELEAAGGEAERAELFSTLLGAMMARGKALSVASFLEVDAVIDPAETRSWLVRARGLAGERRGRRCLVDTW